MFEPPLARLLRSFGFRRASERASEVFPSALLRPSIHPSIHSSVRVRSVLVHATSRMPNPHHAREARPTDRRLCRRARTMKAARGSTLSPRTTWSYFTNQICDSHLANKSLPDRMSGITDLTYAYVAAVEVRMGRGESEMRRTARDRVLRIEFSHSRHEAERGRSVGRSHPLAWLSAFCCLVITRQLNDPSWKGPESERRRKYRRRMKSEEELAHIARERGGVDILQVPIDIGSLYFKGCGA